VLDGIESNAAAQRAVGSPATLPRRRAQSRAATTAISSGGAISMILSKISRLMRLSNASTTSLLRASTHLLGRARMSPNIA
jgi:hypothetical protein